MHVRSRWLMAALLLLLFGVPACAQTSTKEFLPEIDAYLPLNSNVRCAFQAKETIAAGDLTRSDVGASIEAYLMPLEALRRVTVFDLDETKRMPVLFSVGYRYLPAPGQTSRESHGACSHVSFPPEGLSNRGQEPRRSRLVQWQLPLALPQSIDRRAPPQDSFLPSGALRQRRSLLRKPIRKVGRHSLLCWLPVAVKQAHQVRSVLSAREQHGNASQSAEKRCRIDTLALPSQEQEMKPVKPRA